MFGWIIMVGMPNSALQEVDNILNIITTATNLDGDFVKMINNEALANLPLNAT